MPANIRRVLELAPNSFDDPQLGQVAEAVRLAATNGTVPEMLEVRKRLSDSLSQFFAILAGSPDALPLALAEMDAEPLARDMELARVKEVFAEAHEQVVAHPELARAIARTAVKALETITRPAPVNIGDRIAAVRFNIHTPPPQEVTVFQTTTGATIATRGNIGTITAQAKAGKSAFLHALIAAGITPKPDDCDLLGVRAVNPEALPILYLDTEHSPFHHHALCDRILRRAMLTESERLHAYRLTGFPAAEMNAALDHLLAERKWLAVVLDGTAEFVIDVNDPAECNPFVTRIHGLAIQHDTYIWNVLHLNPSSETKSRGHLGSQLERKSETNLRIEKSDGVSVVFADKNRGADIPKTKGPRFAWSNEKQMHVSIASIADAKADLKAQERREQAEEAFRLADNRALYWKDLVAALLKVPGIHSDRTAERIVTDLKNRRLIVKNIAGQWEKAP